MLKKVMRLAGAVPVAGSDSALLDLLLSATMEIFERAKAEQLPTNIVADEIAEERFGKKK